jgi:hypothetical protein
LFGHFRPIGAIGRSAIAVESALALAADTVRRGLTYALIVAVDVRDLTSGLWFLLKFKLVLRAMLIAYDD